MFDELESLLVNVTLAVVRLILEIAWRLLRPVLSWLLDRAWWIVWRPTSLLLVPIVIGWEITDRGQIATVLALIASIAVMVFGLVRAHVID
jgi:hypothetical protein